MKAKKMNIDEYIKWDEIWDKEVCLESTLDYMDEDNVDTINVIKQFLDDKDVSLFESECCTDGDKLIFCFAEFGGVTEGDSQGWSRDYTFTVDYDFRVIYAEYSQG